MKRILIFVMFFLVIVTGLNADTKDKFDNVETPENVMLSFEDAINNKDYERAWNYWSSAPSDNYEKWKKGYANRLNNQQKEPNTNTNQIQWGQKQ